MASVSVAVVVVSRHQPIGNRLESPMFATCDRLSLKSKSQLFWVTIDIALREERETERG